ncbi:hypothetical protein ACFQ0T_29910 [Kitasatospora gansuensis]
MPSAEELAALPDWARAHVDTLTSETTRAREEADARAVELRDLTTKLSGMQDPAVAAAAIREAADKLAATEAQLTRERLGRQYKLPDALVSRIQGADAAAMEADAQALAAFAPAPGVRLPGPDPLQGGGQPAPLSPQDQFAQLITSALNK